MDSGWGPTGAISHGEDRCSCLSGSPNWDSGEPAPCLQALEEECAAGASAMRQGGEAGTWVEGGLLRRQ